MKMNRFITGLFFAALLTSRGEGEWVFHLSDMVSVIKMEPLPTDVANDAGDPIFLNRAVHWIITFHPEERDAFEARIWTKLVGKWPGDNSQVIEIVKAGKRMSATKVGGEPIALETWGALYCGDRTPDAMLQPYIYIRCMDRGVQRFAPHSIHTYRVEKDFSISEAGVVILKEEQENAFAQRMQDMKERAKELEKKAQKPAPTP